MSPSNETQLDALKPADQEMKFYLITTSARLSSDTGTQECFHTFILENSIDTEGLDEESIKTIQHVSTMHFQEAMPRTTVDAVNIINIFYLGRKTYKKMYPNRYTQ